MRQQQFLVAQQQRQAMMTQQAAMSQNGGMGGNGMPNGMAASGMPGHMNLTPHQIQQMRQAGRVNPVSHLPYCAVFTTIGG